MRYVFLAEDASSTVSTLFSPLPLGAQSADPAKEFTVVQIKSAKKHAAEFDEPSRGSQVRLFFARGEPPKRMSIRFKRLSWQRRGGG